MPFKYRLHVFFLILTILPLLLAGWVIQGVSGRNQENQVDGRLITTLAGASRTYTSVVDQARGSLFFLAKQPAFQQAVLNHNKKAIATQLGRLDAPNLNVEVRGANGELLSPGQVPPQAGEDIPIEIGQPSRGRLLGRIPFTTLARTSSEAAGKNQDVYVWANGNRYEGPFAADSPNGIGKYTFANGDVYTGEIHDGALTGRGTYVSKSGDALEGSFVNGTIQGVGTQRFASAYITSNTYSTTG